MDKRIGIVGGGQLGKMMCLAAKAMGFWVAVLDPDEGCPASSVCDLVVAAGFGDLGAYDRLAEACDVITYEFEHISADALLGLERRGVTVYPTASSLAVIQDKFTQKTALRKAGVPVPDFCVTGCANDAFEALGRFGLPMVVKTRRGGYDGKGNFVVRSEVELNEILARFDLEKTPLMAERFVEFEYETSVLACRNPSGEVVVYPSGLNVHVDGVLDKTVVPAPMRDGDARMAAEAAGRVMEVFGGVGMFCVEMFVTDSGVLVNEVAPRPHNSGHYTIEACVTSQFENHIRAVAGLPLGDPSLVRPACMRNLPGQGNGRARVYGAEDALAVKGVKLHIYGKEEVRVGRKMGHVTATAETAEEAEAAAGKAWAALRVKS